MAQVDAEYLGRVFTGTPPYVVSEAKVAEFAAAVGATSAVHTDLAAAQALGYPGVVAPLTFAVVIAQRAEAEYVADPGAGIDFSRVVHANQSFAYDRPITAGDRLHAAVHVTGISERAGITMVTTRTDLTDDEAQPVAQVTSTLAVRGEGT